MKEQWRQALRQKMADYKEPAPEVSWDEIDKALAHNRQQAKAIKMWPRRIAAAALVLVSAGYYLLNREQADIIEETAETLLIEGTIKQEPVAPQQEEKSDIPFLVHVKRQVQQAIQEKKAELAVVEDSVEQLAQAVEEQSEVQAPELQAPEPQAPKPQETKTQEQSRKRSLPEAHPTFDPSAIKYDGSSHKRWTAKAYLSNAMFGNKGFGNSPSNNIMASPNPEEKDGSIPLTDPLTESYSELFRKFIYPDGRVSFNEELNHHHPIHYGLSLRYALNKRWSVESGLSYALLTSDMSLISSSSSLEMEQRLTYIGIPVNVNYQLWSSRYFSVYASVGGMAEKMVRGKRHMVVVSNMTRQSSDESVSIRPLQFSVNGGVGAEFKFVDWLSLYAEPGVGYWFDNGSGVPTYYQDKPFSFNLNVGLRFTIK